MKFTKLSIVICIVFGVIVSSAKAQKFDLRSVDAFFGMAEKIEAGGVIPPTEWDSLFNTPGYVIVTEHFGKQMLKRCMILAFDPQQTAARDSLLGAKDAKDLEVLAAFVVNNYIDMKASWGELKNYRATYDFEGIEKQAIEILQTFLGNPTNLQVHFPNLTFLCFDANARSLNKGIAMDLNRAYKMTTNEIAATLAHEMFHEYRANLLDDDFIRSSPAIRALAVVQNEGMADLVDKHSYSDAVSDPMIPREVFEHYMSTYANTPDMLRRLDSITVCYLDGKIDRAEFSRATKAFFAYDGHPNGYYMASIIQQSGLHAELVRDAANPVAFARLYNQAAKSRGNKGEYIFSPEFMRHIEEMEKTHKKRE